MINRQKVQTTLKSIVDSVYFQPPESVKLQYPCIIYDLSTIKSNYANNAVYNIHDGYSITYITKKADDPNLEKLAMIPCIRHDRTYVTEGLYHHVFYLSNN